MSHHRNLLQLLGATALGCTLALSGQALAADALLSGTIISGSGDKLGGVSVSAKQEGSTITTTVFTDPTGSYVFPPLATGKYRVWAQAVTFGTEKGAVDLGANKQQDFTLKPLADFERQLPGDMVLAALPGDTPDDARMKNIVRKNCTGCHTPSFPLQNKFDEAGWTAILDLMKHVNVLGTYQGPQHEPNPNIETHEKELASYLARARGPGPSSMKFDHMRSRPEGEAARVVFKEYDVPLDPDYGLPVKYMVNDGSDWSLGTPSGMQGGYGLHDASADLDGNLWFTYSFPSKIITVGRIDAKTGEFKAFKLDDRRGIAINTHGIVRDQDGYLWFNTRSAVARSHGGLARIDPKAQSIQVFEPPESMSGTAGTLDVDPQGFVWVTSPDGVLRFDPKTHEFQEFKSVTYKNAQGTATVYGLAADRNGNSWWALMTHDLIDQGDAKSGKSAEIKLQPDEKPMETLTEAERAMYAKFQPPDFNTPFPWAQGPRRLGTDKNGDFVYIGDSFGGNLAKININTKETTYIPMPNPEVDQPYHVAVDKGHNVWTNMWSTDRVAKYDPAAGKWTLYDLPTRGTETRHVSLLEKDGKMEVVLPYSRTRKVAVMTFRSEAEIAAAKQQAAAK
jgi:streptogramin lyase